MATPAQPVRALTALVVALTIAGLVWAPTSARGSEDDDLFGAEEDTGALEEAAWSRADAAEGRRLFAAACAGCHGRRGDARTPAASGMFPPPRDLTSGTYRFRSTASGKLPTRADMLRSLLDGLPGTAMPAWRDRLTEAELRSVVLYLERLSPRFETERPGPGDVLVDVESLSAAPVTPELLERGRVLYGELKCGDCHGPDGDGDGPSEPTLLNNDGSRADTFDFSTGRYKGGYAPEAVYRTFITGLNGTPMPSYEASVPVERDRWALVHYCRSLSVDRGLGFYLGDRPTWEEPVAAPER